MEGRLWVGDGWVGGWVGFTYLDPGREGLVVGLDFSFVLACLGGRLANDAGLFGWVGGWVGG